MPRLRNHSLHTLGKAHLSVVVLGAIIAFIIMIVGCGSSAAPAGSPSPVVAPSNPVVGLWKVKGPRYLTIDLQTFGTIDELTMEFHDDKTYTFTMKSTLNRPRISGDPAPVETESGFWSLDGRRLSLERPNSFGGPTVIMLSETLNYFDYRLDPPHALSFNVTFKKQS